MATRLVFFYIIILFFFKCSTLAEVEATNETQNQPDNYYYEQYDDESHFLVSPPHISSQLCRLFLHIC